MHRLAAMPGGWTPGQEGVIFVEQSPAPIIILTAADTDIQSIAVAQARLPETFPAVRVVNLLQLQQQQANPNPYGLAQNNQLRQMLLSAGLSPAAAAAAASAGGLTPPSGAGAAGPGFPSSALAAQLDDIGEPRLADPVPGEEGAEKATQSSITHPSLSENNAIIAATTVEAAEPSSAEIATTAVATTEEVTTKVQAMDGVRQQDNENIRLKVRDTKIQFKKKLTARTTTPRVVHHVGLHLCGVINRFNGVFCGSSSSGIKELYTH